VTTNSYDAAGNLIKSVTPEGTINYGYDNLNRHTSTWTGNTTSISSGTTATTYTYDTLGRLTTTTETRLNGTNVSLPTTDSYDLNGNLTRELLPNGVTNTYTYDVLNRLTNVSEAIGTTNLYFAVYTLNPDGSRSSEVRMN